jgi:hypothetical protein
MRHVRHRSFRRRRRSGANGIVEIGPRAAPLPGRNIGGFPSAQADVPVQFHLSVAIQFDA